MSLGQVSARNKRKKTYDMLKSKGICACCKKKPTRENKVYCEKCYERKAKSSKQYKSPYHRSLSIEGEELGRKMMRDILKKPEMKEVKLRERIKKRLGLYKGRHQTCMLESDFKSIFCKIANELRLKVNEFDAIIAEASEEQLKTLNYNFDNYQLSKKYKW